MTDTMTQDSLLPVQLPINWKQELTPNGLPYVVCRVTDNIVDVTSGLPLNFRVAKCYDGTNSYLEYMKELVEVPDWWDKFFATAKQGFAVQKKVDGIRCFVFGGVAYSASLRRIPNLNIQRAVSTGLYDGMDGELNHRKLGFRETQSIVMSHNRGIGELQFSVFDFIDVNARCFRERWIKLREAVDRLILEKAPKFAELAIDVVGTTFYEDHLSPEHSLLAVNRYLTFMAAVNFEGCVLRSLGYPYPTSRPTIRSPHMIKVKLVADAEARVVAVNQGRTNNNCPMDELDGTTSRGFRKENYSLTDTAGSLQVIGLAGTPFAGRTFNVSLGSLTQVERKEIFDSSPDVIDKLVTFKYFGFGDYNLPRSPIFKAFRNQEG